MIKKDLIDNKLLLEAGLNLMEKEGIHLERIPNKGRAMLYKTSDGETVRIRTCNDHLLVTVASHAKEGARLSIEGTERLLVVMPETPRTYGPVIAFYVPTKVAEKAIRKAHGDWLKSGANTKGYNTTWNIWFREGGPSFSCGFFKKWEKYRVKSTTVVSPSARSDSKETNLIQNLSLGDIIFQSKENIAKIAGVPPSAVKISVDLG